MLFALLGTDIHFGGSATYAGAETVLNGLALGGLCDLEDGSINRRLGEGGFLPSLSRVPKVHDELRFEHVLQG